MKKLLLVQCALVLLPATAWPQEYAIDEGAVLVAGTADYSRRSSDGRETSTFMFLSPIAHYFIRPGLAVGGRATVAHSSTGAVSTTSFGIGPGARYYFGRGQRKFYPFLAASYSLSRAFQDSGDSTFTRLDFSAGLVLMLARGVGLTGEAYRQRDHFGTESGASPDLDSQRIGVRFGIAASVF